MVRAMGCRALLSSSPHQAPGNESSLCLCNPLCRQDNSSLERAGVLIDSKSPLECLRRYRGGSPRTLRVLGFALWTWDAYMSCFPVPTEYGKFSSAASGFHPQTACSLHL